MVAAPDDDRLPLRTAEFTVGRDDVVRADLSLAAARAPRTLLAVVWS